MTVYGIHMVSTWLLLTNGIFFFFYKLPGGETFHITQTPTIVVNVALALRVDLLKQLVHLVLGEHVVKGHHGPELLQWDLTVPILIDHLKRCLHPLLFQINGDVIVRHYIDVLLQTHVPVSWEEELYTMYSGIYDTCI